MLANVTTTPTNVIAPKPGREFLALQSDEDPETGKDIFLSFGGSSMTEGETPAPAGFRLAPGASLILDNSSPLIKQDAVWACTATGTATLRYTER